MLKDERDFLKTPGEGSVRGHDGIPERMPESSYSCYCLQKKHENKNEKNGGYAIFQHIPRLFIQYNQDLFHNFFHCAALLDYIDTFLQTIQAASYLYTSQSIYFNRSVGNICTHTCNRRAAFFHI